MALSGDSILPWYLAGKELCLQLYYHGRNFVALNRRQYAAGSMAGLSVAASIFLSSPAIPMIFPFGAIFGLVPSTWLYWLQNSKEITRYTGPTALILLAITIFTFHGLGSWRQVLNWFPMFLSATLLTAVHVTPKVTVMITTLGEGLYTIIELGRSFGTRRNQSVDQPLDVPIDVERPTESVMEMSEHQTMEYRGFRSIDSVRNFIQSLPDVRIIESQGRGVEGSINLEIASQTTTPEIMALLEPLNRDPNLASQVIELVPISSLNETIIDFPDAPQDLVLRGYAHGSTSSSRVEEPNPEHLVPE